MLAHPILRIAYDANTLTLQILFATGKLYTYAGVPAELGCGMQRASAKGMYFAYRIRNRFPLKIEVPHELVQLV